MTTRQVRPSPTPVAQTRKLGTTKLRKFAVGAMVLIVGIAVGFGGARALGPRDMPVDSATYEVSPTEITVRVAAGSGAAFALVLLVERSDRVEVSVREQVSRGFSPADLTFYRFTWPLSAPLGSRPVDW